MKIKDLKNKSENELHTNLNNLYDKLRDLRFKVAQKQLKNLRIVRETKKDIAKILTILNRSTE
ncbi:MAG: 50S ribosomal protein L29 [Patescibacteria group bacterium]